MKTLATLLTAGSLLCLTATNVAAQEFIAADDSVATRVCMAVASNRPLNLRLEMKEVGMRTVTVQKKLHCNEMPVAEFASVYNLNRTANFLHLDIGTETSIKDLAAHNLQPIMISGSK
ncbi:DUF3718 domain-containing protein [Pseudoalteromonas fenneropenaei]|uniref:DUF3718 domain-containing protein n=1 Tax=Pseudoalteromonas fenneropenaei TaxID=1737459 RepID=A0ABV7CFM4_9GAMM